MLVEREDPKLTLTVQAELLSLSRSSLYYQPVPPSPREVTIKHHIDEIYTKWPFYGSRRIKAQLLPLIPLSIGIWGGLFAIEFFHFVYDVPNIKMLDGFNINLPH